MRDQVNAMAPGRDTSSDGTIGDSGHQARKSDHNPNEDGVVTAMDITHDPRHGIDAGTLAEMLRASKDKRIKYVISNARIFSSTQTPWQWRPYTGANAHTKHVHVSVLGDRTLYDDTSPWPVDRFATVNQNAAMPSATAFVDITATVFGGLLDRNNSAYDGHLITDQEMGVALPCRFKGKLPKVRVTNPQTGRSVTCGIVDVGPWNTDDAYWEAGARPQAESGTDHRGRKTNRAGIDLTPAAARAIGINGKGKVNWQFVDAGDIEVAGPIQVDVGEPTQIEVVRPTEVEVTRPAAQEAFLAELRQRLEQLQMVVTRIAANASQVGEARTVPTPVATPVPGNDFAALVQQVLATIQNVDAQTKGTGVIPAAQQTEQLKRALDLVTGVVLPAVTGKSAPLGQVNGALGQTIGNLLNGKKTAIGFMGAALTSVLGSVPGGSGLGQVLTLLTPAAGLSQFAMPIFLAFAAWGVLGKFEKWAQGTAPPPIVK